MRRRFDRRVMVLLLGAVGAAFGLQILSSVWAGATSGATSGAASPEVSRGFQLFSTNCATCHGTGGEGVAGKGPSLVSPPAGPAAIDFMLSTGRMPLAYPNDALARGEPQFSQTEIDAIIAYLSSVRAGGPPIPTVEVADGSLPLGQNLFQGNCAACHGAAAEGGSVGGGEVAPSLDVATPTQIGEALRTGPGVMPKFGPEQLSEHDVNSLARTILWLRDNGNAGGLGIGRVGPVAEGFVAWVVGLGLLIIVIRLTGTKT
jgi:ubiquinol-cytochrome c reductase cytochrome c subunit